MNVKETLVAARSIIEDPNHWTRRVPCRDKAGRRVSVDSSEAYSFCALGAIEKANSEAFSQTVKALEPFVPRGLISVYNDSSSHEDVLALFDRAIASLEENDNKGE